MEAQPKARNDLEFFPVRQDGHFYPVRDHLGLSPEGTALGIPLYRFVTLLDGSRSVRDCRRSSCGSKGAFSWAPRRLRGY